MKNVEKHFWPEVSLIESAQNGSAESPLTPKALLFNLNSSFSDFITCNMYIWAAIGDKYSWSVCLLQSSSDPMNLEWTDSKVFSFVVQPTWMPDFLSKSWNLRLHPLNHICNACIIQLPESSFRSVLVYLQSLHHLCRRTCNAYMSYMDHKVVGVPGSTTGWVQKPEFKPQSVPSYSRYSLGIIVH